MTPGFRARQLTASSPDREINPMSSVSSLSPPSGGVIPSLSRMNILRDSVTGTGQADWLSRLQSLPEVHPGQCDAKSLNGVGERPLRRTCPPQSTCLQSFPDVPGLYRSESKPSIVRGRTTATGAFTLASIFTSCNVSVTQSSRSLTKAR